MTKFVVLYYLPSGWWSAFNTDDHAEAVSCAASLEGITGWPHRVVTVPGSP